MNSLWMKIKVWSKVSLLAITLILVLLFIILNIGAVIEPGISLIFVRYERPRLLVVLVLTALISIFGWWLFRTVYKTLKQLREASEWSQIEKREREMADMKSKAAMLHTRPDATE